VIVVGGGAWKLLSLREPALGSEARARGEVYEVVHNLIPELDSIIHPILLTHGL